MNSKIKDKIIWYRFEDRKENLNAIVIGHLLFSFFLLLQGVWPDGGNPRLIICSLILVILVLLLKLYNWHSKWINFIISGAYLFILFLELNVLGMPSTFIIDPRQFASQDFQATKEIVLNLFFSILPPIYIILRGFLFLPLLSILISSFQIPPMHEEEKQESKSLPYDETILDYPF